MIRRVLTLLFLLLILAYLVVAVTVFNTRPENEVCKGVELVVRDSIDHGFITVREVNRLLEAHKLSPKGKEMGQVNTRAIEELLSQHPLIRRVECYRTPGCHITIEVSQRVPLLRVMASNGENYYVDEEGKAMPTVGQSAYVPVATGTIRREFATKELYELALYLQDHPLWREQVEQINVTPSQEIELVPRVGEHIIFMGKPGGYDQKFARLEKFYKKALNEIGWNKYARISLEFDNQIICTKKEK
jgi:cell division protein FtsQ